MSDLDLFTGQVFEMLKAQLALLFLMKLIEQGLNDLCFTAAKIHRQQQIDDDDDDANGQ